MPVAVVTGSSSGIGQQTAIEFARRGYSVLVHARSGLSSLQQTADLVAQHTQTLCVTADIGCPRACRTLVQTAFAWQKRVDVWVNVAGADVLTTDQRLDSFEQRLETLLRVDVAGTVRLSRLVAQQMLASAAEPNPTTSDKQPLEARVDPQITRSALQQHRPARLLPTIINIGWDQSELGMEGEPGQLFCTTKAAVTSFTRALALTVAPHIRVNCVAPGWIKTKWGESAAGSSWENRAKSESLLDRWGEAEEVASTIAWLAGQESQFVNGQCIHVNGGRRFLPTS